MNVSYSPQPKKGIRRAQVSDDDFCVFAQRADLRHNGVTGHHDIDHHERAKSVALH
jgi:hypothetical protein